MAFNDIFSGWGQGPAPSVFGALPYPTPATPATNFVTFYLTSFNPTVLNCTVVGPRQMAYFSVSTDRDMSTYTVVKDAKARSIALVEWQSPPELELRGVFSKRRVKDWLKLSHDKSSRVMDVDGTRYVWAPQDQYINMRTNDASSRLLARICGGQGTITLDVSTEAMQMGLLDPIVLATLLLQSGKNID